jgi:DNA-binding response OmpR family regulator
MSDSDTGRLKVLLLEDEPIIGKVTSRVLAAEGYDVDVAVDGLIAKEKIMTNRYDLMIFDVRTPLMSGIQLYEYLQRAYPQLTGRIIFSTGDSLSLGTKTFLDRVKSPNISKPYTPSQLRMVVRATMDRINSSVLAEVVERG